jgi:hypothetical protein
VALLITFATGKFDITKETPNDINTIAGESVLKWIQSHLAASGFTSTKPRTEDWGWYMKVEGSGASYLVGASGELERPSPDVDWTLQVHKNRSLMDKLTGKNKLCSDDPLFTLLERLVRGESEFRAINVAKDA